MYFSRSHMVYFIATAANVKYGHKYADLSLEMMIQFISKQQLQLAKNVALKSTTD